jgi:lipid-binding SYLF domain-containing protein
MSNKSIALFVGAAVVILFIVRQNTVAASNPATAAGADATVGASPLGAATGTTDANGDPLGGLGSTGGG